MDNSFIKSRLLSLESCENLDWEKFNQSAKDALDKTSELTDYLKLFDNIQLKQIKPASVLITLVKQSDNQWHVILTKRAKHLKNHAGEICFPGGKFEDTDENLQQTALRETQEEIGLEHIDLKIIGKLPEQITISQYYVTPYVAVLDRQNGLNIRNLSIDKNEVEEVFTVPLNYLIDSKNQKLVKRKIKDISFSYHSIEYNDYIIWGATARMLVNLGKLLN
ncbi:MAG: coenzyme A pyrophosphatase [Kangiella sp.]|nr:MAG: coenzyme A pyrophosphatase [Kangiella sp.]